MVGLKRLYLLLVEREQPNLNPLDLAKLLARFASTLDKRLLLRHAQVP